MSEVKFLTMAEICIKLRIDDNTVRRMQRRGQLTGIKLPNGSWRFVDPGHRFEQYLQELDEHLLHIPLVCTAEAAEILETNRLYIHELVRKKTLIPAAKDHHLGGHLFTVAHLRDYMMRRQRRKLNRPSAHQIKLERIVQWAKKLLAQHHAAYAPVPFVRDEMAAEVDRILLLPGPERLQSLRALFLQLDRAQLMVQAHLKSGDDARPLDTPDQQSHSSFASPEVSLPTGGTPPTNESNAPSGHTPETDHSPSLGQQEKATQ